MDCNQMQSNKLVADVNTGCAAMEAISNHLVGAVDVTPFHANGYWRLNSKINSMLGNHVIYDTDVRDLAYIMEELGIRNQWKEMNAQIRAELEGISKHVDAATKVLDANPPAPEPMPIANRYWQNWWTGGHYRNLLVPQTVSMVANPCVFKTTTVVEPTPVKLSVSAMPWQKWHCKMNNEVADAKVEEIIPAKPQKVERRLFGEWDALMEDVLDWHRFGLHRYQVRIGYCPNQYVQYVQK